MPLKRMRQELELIQIEISREVPDLGFLIVHAQALLQHAESASEGILYPDTSQEDAAMINMYRERKGLSS